MNNYRSHYLEGFEENKIYLSVGHVNQILWMKKSSYLSIQFHIEWKNSIHATT